MTDSNKRYHDIEDEKESHKKLKLNFDNELSSPSSNTPVDFDNITKHLFEISQLNTFKMNIVDYLKLTPQSLNGRYSVVDGKNNFIKTFVNGIQQGPSFEQITNSSSPSPSQITIIDSQWKDGKYHGSFQRTIKDTSIITNEVKTYVDGKENGFSTFITSNYIPQPDGTTTRINTNDSCQMKNGEKDGWRYNKRNNILVFEEFYQDNNLLLRIDYHPNGIKKQNRRFFPFKFISPPAVKDYRVMGGESSKIEKYDEKSVYHGLFESYDGEGNQTYHANFLFGLKHGIEKISCRRDGHEFPWTIVTINWSYGVKHGTSVEGYRDNDGNSSPQSIENYVGGVLHGQMFHQIHFSTVRPRLIKHMFEGQEVKPEFFKKYSGKIDNCLDSLDFCHDIITIIQLYLLPNQNHFLKGIGLKYQFPDDQSKINGILINNQYFN